MGGRVRVSLCSIRFLPSPSLRVLSRVRAVLIDRMLLRRRCWEWDVCAGTALLLEAGGYIVDANPPPPSSPLWNPGTDLPLAPLGGRRYLAVRACSAPTTGLSERQAGEGVGEQAGKKGAARREQERVIREVWKRVEPFLYERPV